MTGSMSYGTVSDGDGGAYQTSFITAAPQAIAAGATGSFQSHLFTGAKVVKILDAYQTQYGIPDLYKAVDFGHLYFITKPIFFALDWLNSLLGNFGLAIIVFTVGIKLLFFPLASYSYRSMGKMKLVQPKIKALREQYKDDPTKLQQATMALYKTEKINPASGCLPMLVQIPVFFCLYKVIFITIEMRQTPFYGWIKDLSAPDPTNLFNLFGLVPFDPTMISPMLHHWRAADHHGLHHVPAAASESRRRPTRCRPACSSSCRSSSLSCWRARRRGSCYTGPGTIFYP